MKLGRSPRAFALAALASLLTAPACDEPAPDEGGEIRLERILSVEESVLVCVTAEAPAELSEDDLDAVYDTWSQTGRSRSGFITNYLFRFEDEPVPMPRYMFAMVFSGDPDGLAAAASHREEEYVDFREHLEEAGFTNVSLQSNLLYVNGDAPQNQFDGP